MQDKQYLNGSVSLNVIRLSNRYRYYWKTKGNLYWSYRLVGEVIELFLSLAKLHKDDPKWELLQIASICLNWSRKIDDER